MQGLLLRELSELQLAYQGDPCGQAVKQSSQMKAYYACKCNRNSYIIPDAVMKSHYTNVKYPGTLQYTVCRTHYETIKKMQK